MKQEKLFSFGIMLVLTCVVLISGGCARKQQVLSAADLAAQGETASVSQEGQAPPVKAIKIASKPNPQAKKVKADKKPPSIILLGDAAEIETLGSFKKLAEKKGLEVDYQKQRIEYLLERLSRTTYNFLRNGETHDSKKAILLMRYKWIKFSSEVQTAEDFVDKIASGSRTSGEPYYVKANQRYYLVKDVLFFELKELDQALSRHKEGKVD